MFRGLETEKKGLLSYLPFGRTIKAAMMAATLTFPACDGGTPTQPDPNPDPDPVAQWVSQPSFTYDNRSEEFVASMNAGQHTGNLSVPSPYNSMNTSASGVTTRRAPLQPSRSEKRVTARFNLTPVDGYRAPAPVTRTATAPADEAPMFTYEGPSELTAGQASGLRFGVSDDRDLEGDLIVSVDGQEIGRIAADGTNASLDVTYTPPSTGTTTFRVTAGDRVGTVTDDFSLDAVAGPKTYRVWVLPDIDHNTLVTSGFKINGQTPTFVDDHFEFEARPGDQLRFSMEGDEWTNMAMVREFDIGLPYGSELGSVMYNPDGSLPTHVNVVVGDVTDIAYAPTPQSTVDLRDPTGWNWRQHEHNNTNSHLGAALEPLPHEWYCGIDSNGLSDGEFDMNYAFVDAPGLTPTTLERFRTYFDRTVKQIGSRTRVTFQMNEVPQETEGFKVEVLETNDLIEGSSDRDLATGCKTAVVALFTPGVDHDPRIILQELGQPAYIPNKAFETIMNAPEDLALDSVPFATASTYIEYAVARSFMWQAQPAGIWVRGQLHPDIN